MLFETMYTNEAKLREQYKRVLQVPLIEIDGKYAFYSQEFQDKRKQQSEYYSPIHVYMSKTEWVRTFYGK